MSEIKALEELRKYYFPSETPGVFNEALVIADAIQAEVDERFMELPCDKDGVPIHVGDMIEYEGDEDTYTLHARGVYVYDNGIVAVMNERLGIWIPENCRHVKSRTLEEVLQEFANDVAMQGHQIGLTAHELSDKYAAEIRELLGVDE